MLTFHLRLRYSTWTAAQLRILAIDAMQVMELGQRAEPGRWLFPDQIGEVEVAMSARSVMLKRRISDSAV